MPGPLVGQAKVDCNHRENGYYRGQRDVGCQQDKIDYRRRGVGRAVENRMAISVVIGQVARQKHDRDHETADHRKFVGRFFASPDQRIPDDQDDERQRIKRRIDVRQN